ncbi:MAG: endonuclease/exonuclease/phosphatase family protein [Planctomycetota bacterium]
MTKTQRAVALLGALLLVATCAPATAQEQPATKPATPKPTAPAKASTEIMVGFWNIENLFDYEDDKSNPGDDEFLPSNGWTKERYGRKLAHLAEIIAELDCHFLGFSEVENQRVLTDLIQQKALAKLGYSVAHLDTPDKRGIDLAAIYRAPVKLADGDKSIRLHPIPIDPPTRGVFEVKAEVAGQPFTVLVNHWPSRRGGSAKSRPLRQKAAETTKRVTRVAIDAARDHSADVIVLGDFNDDPFDESVRYHLGAIRNSHAVKNRTDKRGPYRLYNPTWLFFGKPGMGTLYYNREWTWNLFDQIIVSRGLLDDVGLQLVANSIDIYAPDKMRDHYRRPIRFRKQRNGKDWTEGYSDHLPIRAKFRVMAKEAPKKKSL